MPRLLATLIIVCMMAISYHANAAYVYTYGDDNFLHEETGQEWLRLTTTFGKSLRTSLSENEGYRSATKDEVSDLMDFFFPTATYNYGTMTSYNHVDEAKAFEKVVGYKTEYLSKYSRRYSTLAFFSNELLPDRAIMSGSERYTNGNYVRLFSTDYTANYPNSYAYINYGSWLVKDTVVPIPAAVWLFGTGLLGLIAVARRKA